VHRHLWRDLPPHQLGVASQDEIILIATSVNKSLVPSKPTTTSLPTSQSYLKIDDVPYFKGSTPITSTEIYDIMGLSHMVSSFSLANTPCVMQNSHKSDTATMWFNIADSQLGASAKCLISSTLQIGPGSCYIRAAHTHPGTPLCQCCWHWGHLTKACHAQAHVAQGVLDLTLRPAIAHSLAAVEETPQLHSPSPQPLREPHALMPHGV
jgi:hypothetical protein